MNDRSLERQLVINSNTSETRIALVEKGEVSEIFIERIGDHSLVGNIYKGVVTRVLPGMNSAFIDIGLNRSAFLFGGDVIDPDNEGLAAPSEEDLEAVEEDQRARLNKKPIDKILHDGQQIIVQISKEPLGTKGPRVTMFLTIPGRYLVLMPRFSHIGISRRIEDEAERERLRDIVVDLAPEDTGVIIRTAARGIDEDTLKRDLIFLKRTWQKVESNITLSKAPSLLYCDLDIIKKTTRDLFDDSISKIIIDDKEAYRELNEFLSDTIPQATSRLELYEDQIPIFDSYGIEMDIARALGTRVELPSGGYLVIDQTEALTSFDVNTGKFVGKVNARQTILKTNLEAARKVVEQLRIRNIGGIIIVDFIDMERPEDREAVFHAFQEELKHDRARTNVLRISELGLVQMTRKRTSESLERQLLTPCHLCEGRGQIRSVVTEAHDLLREIIRTSIQTGHKNIQVRVRPDIQEWLQTRLIDRLNTIKREYGIDINFHPTRLSIDMLREPAFEVFTE